ncbi:MAG: hypothetical protein LBQ88_07710 [Treponema sp.]|jgi:hypothetical protein|nr:hypothetical protein [Treponema sp.]
MKIKKHRIGFAALFVLAMAMLVAVMGCDLEGPVTAENGFTTAEARQTGSITAIPTDLVGTVWRGETGRFNEVTVIFGYQVERDFDDTTAWDQVDGDWIEGSVAWIFRLPKSNPPEEDPNDYPYLYDYEGEEYPSGAGNVYNSSGSPYVPGTFTIIDDGDTLSFDNFYNGSHGPDPVEFDYLTTLTPPPPTE